MKAMVLHAVGEPLRLEDRPDPVPEARQIAIAIEACAVCRTGFRGKATISRAWGYALFQSDRSTWRCRCAGAPATPAGCCRASPCRVCVPFPALLMTAAIRL